MSRSILELSGVTKDVLRNSQSIELQVTGRKNRGGTAVQYDTFAKKKGSGQNMRILWKQIMLGWNRPKKMCYSLRVLELRGVLKLWSLAQNSLKLVDFSSRAIPNRHTITFFFLLVKFFFCRDRLSFFLSMAITCTGLKRD